MRIQKTENLTVAVIGKDGRTSAITSFLESSPRVRRPVKLLSRGKASSLAEMLQEVRENALRFLPDLVVVGPEEPLAGAVVDELAKLGIPCVGPVQALAILESSKAFTRDLVARHHIVGNPEYRVFENLEGIPEYLQSLGDFVIKPDGLTGGKGVKVSGDHLQSISEGVAYCSEILRPGSPVVIEEKLDGEEFSLQSFCDGSTVKDMVVVQDHKRVNNGDTGPNTGGMGSYSCADHLLPFLDAQSLAQASAINRQVVDAVRSELGESYKGILFGGFMLTKNGVRLLEYNVRFGDPESLNVLSLLETDFAEICLGIINGRLDEVPVRFRRQATVCKYIVPKGYPLSSETGKIDLSEVPAESEHLRAFDAAIDRRPNGDVFLTGSRAIAFVGIGDDLAEAESYAENAASAVDGPVHHRTDIGTESLVQRRVDHMEQIRHKVAV